MQIKFFCPRWGSESIPWIKFCEKAKEAGFDGVETAVPFGDKDKNEITASLETYSLLLIGQYYQSLEKDFELHKENHKKHLHSIAALKPLLIDSQTGKDYYTVAQNSELFRLASQITAETGVMIAHETHRNKALFAAHVAKQLLTSNPGVVITADFSHWCNVSESLLEQQEDALKIAISRTVHIHARVGHSQSAQVSDPRAGEWQTEVNAHLKWWDDIVKSCAERRQKLLTITPEFGPVPYMPAIPYTKMPVAEQWEINVYMMNFLKERYQKINSCF